MSIELCLVTGLRVFAYWYGAALFYQNANWQGPYCKLNWLRVWVVKHKPLCEIWIKKDLDVKKGKFMMRPAYTCDLLNWAYEIK
jgi:hypothetical protein